jgi:stage II sporulation protein D
LAGAVRESATLDPVRGLSGMPIRPFLIILVAALFLSGSASPRSSPAEPPSVRTPPTFFVMGHGWGHGLGMSQYGAYGYAQHGWKYDRIVKHYYTGTTIGQAPISRVRVLLTDKAKQVTIASNLPFQVVDAAGHKHALDAGSYPVGAAFKFTDPANPQAKPQALVYPLEFRPGSTAVSLNGRAYRGSLRVLKLGTASVRVVNVVDLDLYLRGVVPSEMPKDWAPEALKAQAVAARSYALSHLHAGGGFDLYPDTRDQVYLGIPHEAPATTAAVSATAGQVVLYKGKVASTYFFSTSGGRTAANEEIWGGAPVPYLRSVADPYDRLSPYHRWSVRFRDREAARRLADVAPGRLRSLKVVMRTASGRAAVVAVRGRHGTARVPAATIESALGLRSTWFSFRR